MKKMIPIAAMLFLLLLWQGISLSGLVPRFMLPSPIDVGRAFIGDFPLLMEHAGVTLAEAFLGLFTGIAFAFGAAVLMDRFATVYQGLYPLIVLTQTVPAIAIAPLLILWFGYGILPKVILIVVITFFPITVGLLDGFRSADKDAVDLFRAMGSSKWQIFRYIKLPGSLSHFFAGFRVSAAYAIVGAVISEWLGGNQGLGVYMVRVQKSFSFDKMFAVIFFISALSLLLLWLVDCMQKAAMPWDRTSDNHPVALRHPSKEGNK